jgi:hypothetical protein
MFVPITEFAPDLPQPVTGVDQFPQPGQIVEASNIISTMRGYAIAPAGAATNVAALGAACTGMFFTRKTDGTTRSFAATATDIYELSTASWTDQGSKTSSTARVRFIQWGNITLMCDGATAVQESSTTTFAALSAMPKYRAGDAVGDFVVIGDTNEATYGHQEDRWWTSAIGDYTNWTPAIATQCATGRLLDTPGPITAVRRLSSTQTAIYKQRAVYLGTMQGPPVVFAPILIANDRGAVSQEAVVDIGYKHLFFGYDGVYSFDGSAPVEITGPIKSWLYGRVDFDRISTVQALHDRNRSSVYWWYPALDDGGTLQRAVAYNYRTGKWGTFTQAIEATAEMQFGGVTYSGFGAFFTGVTNWDDLPTNVTYDSGVFSTGSPFPAIINTSHALQTMNGSASSGMLRLWDIGNDTGYSRLRRITPRHTSDATTGTMQHRYRDTSGADYTDGRLVTLSRGRYDVNHSARWHQVELTQTGTWELMGIDYDLVSAGRE